MATDQGAEEVFFASEPIHNVIKEQRLKTGDEFILSRVQNGRAGSTKLEISIIGKSAEGPQSTDNLCQIMLQCVQDAAFIVSEMKDVGFRTEDLRSIVLSLFIARSK